MHRAIRRLSPSCSRKKWPLASAAHLAASIHELTRAKAIPHRKLPGCRRCPFKEDDLRAWEDGVDLEGLNYLKEVEWYAPYARYAH